MSTSSAAAAAEDALPRVIVFDLDGTLWNPEMYQLYGGAPFQPHKSHPDIMVDKSGTEVRLIGEVRAVLQELLTHPRWRHTHLAVSSTCDIPAWANELLRRYTFTDAQGQPVTMGELFGDRLEIYNARKSAHHRTILKKVQDRDPTVTDFSQMLFFDNQTDNVRDVSKLGVTCCYCANGLTPGTFARGLELFRKNRAAAL